MAFGVGPANGQGEEKETEAAPTKNCPSESKILPKNAPRWRHN